MVSKKHLPFFGVGPLYVAVILALTLAGILAARFGILGSGASPALRRPFAVLGVLLVLSGAALWLSAGFHSRIYDGIRGNRLVTTGVYRLVRNPIYTAFLFACTGALLLAGNLWLLLLPPCYWLYLTLLMRATEERWLREKYGQEYLDYCRRVNRCIPWFPRRDTRWD